MDGYLATPMGKLKYYNYANDVIKVLQQWRWLQWWRRYFYLFLFL
jgi:hypothetical protein